MTESPFDENGCKTYGADDYNGKAYVMNGDLRYFSFGEDDYLNWKDYLKGILGKMGKSLDDIRFMKSKDGILYRDDYLKSSDAFVWQEHEMRAGKIVGHGFVMGMNYNSFGTWWEIAITDSENTTERDDGPVYEGNNLFRDEIVRKYGSLDKQSEYNRFDYAVFFERRNYKNNERFSMNDFLNPTSDQYSRMNGLGSCALVSDDMVWLVTPYLGGDLYAIKYDISESGKVLTIDDLRSTKNHLWCEDPVGRREYPLNEVKERISQAMEYARRDRRDIPERIFMMEQDLGTGRPFIVVDNKECWTDL